MAKLFYTLKEAAEKLKMSEMQVRELASHGQLQEFRDRDKLMFKVDQVNLLAMDDEDTEIIPLAEPSPGNIFEEKPDEDGTSLLDLTRDLDADEGSGLLDLTMESDDTKLGQSLLEGLDDYRNGRGRVLLRDERPATTIDRFAHFTQKEMQAIRTALTILNIANDREPAVKHLLDEIDNSEVFAIRRHRRRGGFFSRLFGIC